MAHFQIKHDHNAMVFQYFLVFTFIFLYQLMLRLYCFYSLTDIHIEWGIKRITKDHLAPNRRRPADPALHLGYHSEAGPEQLGVCALNASRHNR